MLKQHSQFVIGLLVLADAVAVSTAWLVSYWLRFSYLPIDPQKGLPALTDKFLPMLPVVVICHLVIFYRLHLYRPRRSEGPGRELRDIVKAFVVAVVVVVLIDYAFPQPNKLSRQFVATYAVVGTTLFALFRVTVRLVAYRLRSRGFNRRTAVIVGAGRSGQRLLQALRNNGWTGLDVLYFVDERDGPAVVHGVPVRGPLDQLAALLDEQPADCVFLALSAAQAPRLNDLLAQLTTSMADVQVVPDISPSYAMRPNVGQLDGVPILLLRQTPLHGWNAIEKRAFDLVVGTACLIVALVPMLAIAVVIKLTNRGPVFYRQRRMGLDGRAFMMLKFRTMRVDAEANGPVWSQTKDPRRTRLGAFLRQTSLDELPNLFNVLAGQMSLVGPRPERPEFIAEFKREIPNYMLRHKIKAGMTGYAQVKGWRGNTSLHKRIQHDVHYIRHWSLGLDAWILAQTVLRAWFSRHEDVGEPGPRAPSAPA